MGGSPILFNRDRPDNISAPRAQGTVGDRYLWAPVADMESPASVEKLHEINAEDAAEKTLACSVACCGEA